MRKLVRKSYTPVVPIANNYSTGYPHDGRADNEAYRHDRRADNAAYQHDRRADSLSQKNNEDGFCEGCPIFLIDLNSMNNYESYAILIICRCF